MHGTLRNLLGRWTAFASAPQRPKRRTVRRSLAFDALESRDTPTTITVNNAGDRPVAPFNPADVTLRDAIARAAALAGADNIVFAAGINTVTLGNNGTDPFSQFPLNQDLQIDGSTSGGGRVNVVNPSPLRIFDVSGSNFTLQDITLQGGIGVLAGGVMSVSGGTVIVRNSDLSSGLAFVGGGMAVSGGSTTLSTVNFANNTGSSSGGGLYISGGAVDMTTVNFTGNKSNGQGGGLLVAGGGSYTLNGSTFTGNSADEGGAFYVQNTTTLTLGNATIANNSATTRGGGAVVNSSGTLNADAVVFGGVNAGDANTSPFGAAITSAGTLNLTRITVARNSSSGGGGGIRIDTGSVAIIDSTISSNQGAAGLYVAGGTVSLINDTIANNGGFGVFNSSATFSGNSLYSGNASGNFSGVVLSLGTNLFSDAGTAGINGTDLINTNPQLLGLAANGAVFLSFTHAFQPGSPAFNAGNNTLVNNFSMTTDQRGAPRISSGVTDIGAYELYDIISPTATPTTPANINSASPANTTTVVVTYADPAGSGLQVTSGVNPATFGANDITVSNGATVTGFSVSGLQVTYTIQSPGASWSVSPQGTYTVTVVAGNVRDFALNSVGSASTSFVVDTVPPAASLTTPPANINAATGGNSANSFTVTYTDAVSGLNLSTIGNGDLIASNGAVTATVTVVSIVSNANTANVMYQVNAPNGTWDASPQGTYTIALIAGSVLDNFGNPVAGNANFASFGVSTIRPFGTLTTQPANITVANAAPGTNSFTITYTTLGAPLNPASYGVNDVTVSNGATTLTVISVTNNNNAVTYTVQAPAPTGMWTGMPQGLYTIALNGNSVFDISGNAVLANPTLGFFTVDAFRPTATMTTPPPNINANSTGAPNNTFTITYDDIGLGVDPSTFATTNVTVSNGATNLTVSTASVVGNVVTYTVLAPNNDWATAPAGTYTVSLVGNGVKDLAGNGITANPNFGFFVVDLVRPTATLTAPPPNINAANAGPGTSTFTITYADVGSGMNPATFVPGNVTVANGATTLPVSIATIAGNVVTYRLTPAGGWGAVPSGTYTVALNASAADFAANTVLAVANFGSFTVDVTAPTVVVSPTGTITNASPIVFTLAFSEPVTGLTTAGITVTGGAAGALTQVTTSQYTLPVTPTADGIVTVTVNAGAAQDASGNPSIVSNTASVTSDRTGPVASFVGPSPTATVAGPVTYTITWADPNFSSVSLTPSQVILNRTGTANGTVSSVTGVGNTRLVTITDVYGNGSISISLPAGVAVDTVGNTSAAAGPSSAFTVSGNRVLNISQPAAPRLLLPGSSYVYQVNYSNTGNQISPNALITVNVPNYGTFVPASSTSGWTNTGGTQYQFALGNLAIGASGQVAFAVRYATRTPPGTLAQFTASITDDLGNGPSSTVISTIVDPNRLRWGRCC